MAAPPDPWRYEDVHHDLHRRGTRDRRSGRRPRPDARRPARCPAPAPEELGGDGDGVNPEQFLAVGYAACFEAVMTAAARRVKLAPEQVADVAIEANVMLNACEDRTFELAVRLGVELPSVADLA